MTEYLGTGRKKKGAGKFLGIFLALVVVGGLTAGGIFTLRAGEAPLISLKSDKPAMGKVSVFTISVNEPKRGLSAVQVELLQEGMTVELLKEVLVPQSVWAMAPNADVFTKEVVVDRAQIKSLREGSATIRVTATAAGTWLKSAPAAKEELTLKVRLRPPTLEVRSQNIYPAQGGCEVVIYAVGDTATRHGVSAGQWFFPGYPLPGGAPDEYFALFAVPYDQDSVDDVKLVASDEVDNTVRLPFVDRFTKRPFATDIIRVSKRVMKRVVPKIMSRVPSFEDKGGLVQNYVSINSDMRAANNKVLEGLVSETQPQFLWNQTFVQMRAKAVSQFADRRTYYHEDKKIDRQDHLGFDLASTRRAPIPAANSGTIVFADYLGIYGNAVVIDHGYGLMSLYGHLSEISVKLGDNVERAQTIGRTGATGLALGDHLHFTMMLHGLPVTPLEWWDEHWLTDRLASKLGAALGFKAQDKE